MDKVAAEPIPVDLDTCAREPIRIPGGIQPHGALIVLDSHDLSVLQSSANAGAMLGLALERGSSLAQTLGASLTADLARLRDGAESMFLRTATIGTRPFHLSAVRSAQGLLLEFEPAPEDERETLAAVYPRLRAFVEAIGETRTVLEIASLAVKELRALTGFNRVMLYSFDAPGDGTVLAECGDDVLPSYLDLRFPASDIPRQARELYRTNRLRIIPDVDYEPSPILPALSPIDGRPLDLSAAALRSVSPIHLEYMRNMETAASMSMSLLVDGKLWGLISCHNRSPRVLNPQLRSACDFLGNIVSLQIGARERAERALARIGLKQVETELLARMSREADFHAGVVMSGDAWLRVVGADGVAVLTTSGLTRLGLTPSDSEIRQLAARLQRAGESGVFATDHLTNFWPEAEVFAPAASGLLSASISQLHASYIMWFRQEAVRTVRWAGDPGKEAGADRLHPRKSFDIWKQQLRQRSKAWSEVERDTANDLRNSIIDIVLRQAEERAALSEQLQRINVELESFSYSVSHDLRAPFRHIVGYAELLKARAPSLDEKSRHFLKSIVDSALHAGRLVDDLLAFSQMGRASLASVRVDMRKLVAEVRRAREHDLAGREVHWHIGDLPEATGDPSLLRQVWTNLIDNALKYSASRERAVIEISATATDSEVCYRVSDNGVGFEMAYVSKLFGVFQRLHLAEQYPGTGIGLALVKRIVERHGGTVSAQGQIDKGATFGFCLPRPGK